jgi:hypothetical protein
MKATELREKRQITLPKGVVQAAGLKTHDLLDWRFEDGEVRGRKLQAKAGRRAVPRGSLLKYLTPEWDREVESIAADCVQEPE